MKKSSIAAISVMGTVGGLLLAIGMCMCLLPEWNAFTAGVILAVLGAVVLVAIWPVSRKASDKAAVPFNGRTVLAYAIGIAGALILGVGMCMTMVWTGLMIPGIIVGCAGLLVCVLNMALRLAKGTEDRA